MENISLKLCTALAATLMLGSCADRPLQAPAIYAAPTAQEGSAVDQKDKPQRPREREPRNLPPMPMGGDTLGGTPAPVPAPAPQGEDRLIEASEQEARLLMQNTNPVLAPATAGTVQEQEAARAVDGSVAAPTGILSEPPALVEVPASGDELPLLLDSSTVVVFRTPPAARAQQPVSPPAPQRAQNSAAAAPQPPAQQKAASRPASVQEEELLIEEMERVELVERPATYQEPARQQREQPAAPEVVREQVVVTVPAAAAASGREERRLQLLEDQNKLLEQQIRSMQTQQNYFQQQNQRLLSLALAGREEAGTTVIVQPDTSQRYRQQSAAENSAYARMEARLALLNKEVASLQTALAAAEAPDTLQAGEPKPAVARDTVLLNTIDGLRQQLTALQQAAKLEEAASLEKAARLQEAAKDPVVQQPDLNVYFASGASSLSEADKQALQGWVEQVQALPAGSQVVLNGFTDKSGSPSLNLRLANKRIEAVKAALVSLGLAPDKIKSGYMGIDLQQEELAQARRVQLVVQP